MAEDWHYGPVALALLLAFTIFAAWSIGQGSTTGDSDFICVDTFGEEGGFCGSAEEVEAWLEGLRVGVGKGK